MKNNKAGFTLIEIVIVLGIIGVIATLSAVSLNSIRQNSRNAIRISDIKQIQSALELYRAAEKSYPSSITVGQALMGSTSSSTYMARIPSNPDPRNDGDCPDSDYYYENDGTGYKIDFCLSNAAGNLTAGKKCATPQGISDGECFVCGQDNVLYQNKTYHTVQINNQCWLRENLDVGTMVSGVSSEPPCHNITAGYWSCQVNPDIIEKYCYQDDANNCNTYGGLYEWTEMMGFPYQCGYGDFSSGSSNCGTETTYTINEKHQGICPTGWHIPSQSDWHELELGLATNTCNENRVNNWECSPAGATLQTISTSTFSALAAGDRFSSGGFMYINQHAIYWITRTSGNYDAFYYAMIPSRDDIIQYNYSSRNYGFPVRCLRD